MADPQYGGTVVTMLYAGDDIDAKTVAAQLATDLGFEPIDLGPLSALAYWSLRPCLDHARLPGQPDEFRSQCGAATGMRSANEDGLSSTRQGADRGAQRRGVRHRHDAARPRPEAPQVLKPAGESVGDGKGGHH